jgi:hypothetical protein
MAMLTDWQMILVDGAFTESLRTFADLDVSQIQRGADVVIQRMSYILHDGPQEGR